MSQIPSDFYPLRINLPGYGPKIIAFLATNLSTMDLRDQPCYFQGYGAPAAGTLLAGNGKYIVNDSFFDMTAKALWTCATAGTNATSVWEPLISGHIRGEYISTGDYWTDDIVVVASGANAGTYGCPTCRCTAGCCSLAHGALPP